MVILRQRNTVLTETNDIFGLIDTIKTYIPDLPERIIATLRQNAFCFSVKSAQIRLGKGYIIETK